MPYKARLTASLPFAKPPYIFLFLLAVRAQTVYVYIWVKAGVVGWGGVDDDGVEVG